MNEVTIQKIEERFFRALCALEDVLGADINGPDGAEIAGAIVKYLITTERGREATNAEVFEVMKRMEEVTNDF